jgi:EAL domain-containing protein (putative c-di-GMP-specific phosphodiesterase class I)
LTKVSVNVSARQFADPGFLDDVTEILRHTGVTPDRLMIEITETAVLNATAAVETIRHLRSLGLQIALDDFGTGQSSLSLLLELPVDVLKVDKSFVSGSAADRAGAVIVESLIAFTAGLRIRAVAEGVETAVQADRLYRAGYRLAQGYHFSPPVTASEIEAQLAGRATVPVP